MGDFITGVLLQSEDGATYQGRIYDRFLRLRHLHGQVLSLFDPFGPLSTDLSIGEVYEVILASLGESVRYFSEPPLTLENTEWQGVIIEPHWRAPESTYQRTSSELYAHDWVLLGTSLGRMLISPTVFKTPIKPEGFVQWDNIRLDLLAVV
ncbi:MAG: hypothetical protein NVS3B14_05740 [Ktedonobacteraceae bacterium]